MSTPLTYELFVHATPDRVWKAITEGQESAQYFFGTAISSTYAPGAAYQYAFPNGDAAVRGEISSVETGRALSMTWRVLYDPTCAGEISHVTWRLELRGPITKLTLTHDCREAPNTARNVSQDGWSLVLSGLKTLVETGHGLPQGDQS